MLASLKFHGILNSIDIIISEATTHGWGHGEFLSALVTDEKSYRDNQKSIRRVRSAQFRTDACFERFDLTAKRNLTRPQIQDLMHLQFIRDPRNVLIGYSRYLM